MDRGSVGIGMTVAALEKLIQLGSRAAPHIPKAKKGLTLFNKLSRTANKGRTVATQGRELLKLGTSKPFPNTLVNATQKSKLLQTQRNNLMLRGGEGITKLPWWHPKKLLWEKALFDVVTGDDPINRHLKNRRLKIEKEIEKEKTLKQKREAYLADPDKAPGAIKDFDKLTPDQMAEAARLAKEFQLKEEAKIKAEQLKKRSELNTKKVLPPKSNVNDSKVTKLKNKARVLPTSILTQGKSTLKSNRKELNRLLLGR